MPIWAELLIIGIVTLAVFLMGFYVGEGVSRPRARWLLKDAWGLISDFETIAGYRRHARHVHPVLGPLSPTVEKMEADAMSKSRDWKAAVSRSGLGAAPDHVRAPDPWPTPGGVE